MEALLALEGLTKEFRELVAVDRVDLEIREDEVTAIIGPNGAGKTTLFNLLTGRFPPTAGAIRLRGERIDGEEPHEIVRRGIARSYQITNFFPDLTALENVRLAAQARHTGFGPSSLLRHYSDLAAPMTEARAILDRLDLGDIAETRAAALSHGQQRHLEIGIALAVDPDVLLMDEPTAGMSPEETGETVDLITELSREVTLVIVEHDMDVVMQVANRIAVMNRGSILTVGTPEAVRRDEAVQEAYLGGGAI